MENINENKIYFIYSQKGQDSKIEKIEKNNLIENVEIIKEGKKDDYIYSIYCLELQKNDKGEPYEITLIDKNGKLYFKNINSKDISKFIYEMNFQSLNTLGNDLLNQIALSYIEQFNIFENYFKNDYINLNDLFLNSINDLSKGKIELFLFLFFKIYNLYLNKPDDLIKNTLIKYFEELNLNLLENEINKLYKGSSIIKNNLNVDSNDLELLSNKDTYKLRDELISITGNKEELNIKIDVLLGFYYINYKHKLFINFVDPKKDKYEEIKTHLMSNKKIFRDFNSEIINDVLLNEAENFEQIQYLLYFVSNMIEIFKIISNYSIYIKLVYLTQIENTILDLMKICKPQKSDDIDELIKYFDLILYHFLSERILPIKINKDFFIEYCNLFLNEDYEKIEKVHSLLKNYNSRVNDKFKIKIDDEIDKYYHNTGMHLIRNKKLINKEMIEFLQRDRYFKDGQNPIPIDILTEGIILDEIDNRFLNDFFNNKFDEFDLKEIFGHLYYDFVNKIFARLKKCRDLFPLRRLKIEKNIDIKVLENLIYTIKRLWMLDPKNHLYGLEALIANTLGESSIKIINYQSYINDIENSIEPNIILPVYSLLLSKNYDLSDTFKDHVIKYIINNCGNSPISIWYFLNTIEDGSERNKYLEQNLKPEYAVKVENFIDYPIFTDEKITLFTNLYNAKYFIKNENLTNMQYYKDSIDSINNIYNLKFNDTMKIFKNILTFQTLFLFFIPGRFKEENAFIVESLLIDFSEKCENAKIFYDSLNLIYNYWNTFFKKEKKDEINKLKNIISLYEKTPLKDCEKTKNETKEYLSYLPEAKKGTKLMDSIFFISIYEFYKDKYIDNDKERFEQSLNKFNELQNLGINSNINSLEKELKDILIDSSYKNKDKLENEIDFIKSYFGFDSGDNNFNIIQLRESISKLVKEYQK